LRGPQGTLFGRNTTAGAISVVTRGPSFTFDGVADVSFGNYGYLQARGSLTGPIVTDKLAASFSFEAQRRDGFLTNTNQLGTTNGQDSFSVRGQLLYKPIEALKLRLIVDYARLGQTCCQNTYAGQVTQFDNGTPLAYPWAQRVSQFPGFTPLPDDPAQRKTDADRQREFRVGLGGVALRADWDLGDNTLTSITSGRYWNTSPRNDGDQTALDIVREGNADDRQKQFTQELRIASNGEKALDYVGGLYSLYQHLPTFQRMDYGPQAGEYYIAPDTQGLTPEQRRDALLGSYYRAPFTANTLSVAAFGQATWHVAPKIFDLTGGLRDTFERKWGHYEQEQYSSVDTSGLNDAQIALRNAYNPTVPYYELDKSWNALSGLATASVHLGEDALAFATYSRGSKSGGLNFANLPRDANGQVRTDLAVLKPEKVNHFEVGVKSQWFGRRLTANVAVFNTEIKDYQNTIVDQSGTVFIWYLSNVGAVRSRGFEFELKAAPVKGITLYGAGTYADAIYKDYPNAQCPWELRAPGEPTACDLSGHPLPVAPKFSAAAGGDFSTSLTASLSGFIGADYSYHSSYSTTTNDSRYSWVAQTALVNARLGLRDSDGRWEAQLWSQNLFNKLYFLSRAADEQTGRYGGLLGDPRTYGGTLRYYFY
jgi:iron complex outermembrane recepter protein